MNDAQLIPIPYVIKKSRKDLNCCLDMAKIRHTQSILYNWYLSISILQKKINHALLRFFMYVTINRVNYKASS